MKPHCYHIRIEGEPGCCRPETLRPVPYLGLNLPEELRDRDRHVVCEYQDLQEALNAAADLKTLHPGKKIEVIDGRCPRPEERARMEVELE